MKCVNCGIELENDVKFCSHCGKEVVSKHQEESTVMGKMTKNNAQSNGVKNKLIIFWKKLDSFCKILTVGSILVTLLGLNAYVAGNDVAVFCSVLQLIGIVVAFWMHKGIVRLEENKKWIKYLTLAAALLLTVYNVHSYSGKQVDNNNLYYPLIPPYSNMPGMQDGNISSVEKVPYGADECIGQDFAEIKNEFIAAGFSVKLEKIEDLKLADANRVNTIEQVLIEGNTDFTKGQEFSKESEVVIRYHCFEKCDLTILVDFIPNIIFSRYDVKLYLNGIEKGTLAHGEDAEFKLALDPGEYTIAFKSSDSSTVKGEVTLMIDCDIETSYKISCYSDKVSIETLYVDRFTELAEGEAKLNVAAYEYKYKNYQEVESALKTLGFTNIKYNVLYDIVWGITKDGEVDSVSIAGKTDFNRGDVFAKDVEIIITYHMPKKEDPSNIKMPSGSSAYIGLSYIKVQQEFENLGFTNIKVEKVTTENASYADGEVFYVKIAGWSFDSGDIFEPSDMVHIKYYSVSQPKPPRPVFYSTNDYETAKKGNTGVFSYKNKSGAYDIYWIINFDEGYVYWFTEGNGETTCDKVKIVSGQLNDRITVTWHDGGEQWSWYLHFKYKNHPETLIVVDHYGFSIEYTTTDLDDALELRDSKEIKEY